MNAGSLPAQILGRVGAEEQDRRQVSVTFDFPSLRAAYRDRTVTPSAIIDEVLARIAASGEDGVWITRVPEYVLRAAAAAVERRLATEGTDRMPLYGLPFAVKDNIDVAGLPTTCACPGFAHVPPRSAPVVERLLRAGALLVGKTNLDQFATGLVGVRSPYGIPRNRFDPAFIPGGSSSGSAVAVATGLVAFALGTDTAGSGRVPAAFNNIIGLKPTRGLISARGVMPACRSLDCVSIFALSAMDAAAVLDVATGYDEEYPYSRPAPPDFASPQPIPARFGFGMVSPEDLEFFGNADGPRLYAAAAERLASIGGEPVKIDFEPFLDATDLVYRGPWLAERYGAIEQMIAGRFHLLHPAIREILMGANRITAPDVFAGLDRLGLLRQQTRKTWERIDLLLLPTTGTIYRIAEIEAEPIALNESLGRYTNFANLLDLSAIAVPAGFGGDGLPFGVTLFAPALRDRFLTAIAKDLTA